MADDERGRAPERPTDPGTTKWASGEVTDGKNEAGDLTTAGDVLRAETGQDAKLDEIRPGPETGEAPEVGDAAAGR